LMTRIALRSVEKINGFEDETGQPLAFVQSGSMAIARRPQDAQMIQSRVAYAKGWGIDVDLISPEEAAERNPLLRPKGITAVSFTPKDLYLEPIDVPTAYAKALQRLGSVVMPDTMVEDIVLESGAVSRVVTDKGVIKTKIVVDAAGAWLRQIAALAGSTIRVVPMLHQIMITEPLAAIQPGQPITRVLDANAAMRPYKGGLMLGGYEHNPRSYRMSELPKAFRIQDLKLDISVLRGIAALIQDQFPIFQTAAIQEHRGGLPTMTADGHHIVGKAPGVDGLYVIGGCNVGGLSVSPALGEELAKLIVTGKTNFDLGFMAPGRFTAALSETELLERCTARYANYYTYRFKSSLPSAA
jgi:glycine/D-amino acid oxidase-like deaminating enzyme